MIIGVGGKKQSGKDTVAGYIASQYGYEKRAFAGPIKQALEVIFDWDSSVWETEEQKTRIDPRWGISPRQASQHMGTEWGQLSLKEAFPEFAKVSNRNLWVNRALHDYNRHMKIVFSDMRFVHEARAIKERGGYLILVKGRNDSDSDTHPSEMEVKEIQPDLVISNVSSLEFLYKQVEVCMEGLTQLE